MGEKRELIKFGSVHEALNWYFNKLWKRRGAPKQPRNSSMIKVDMSRCIENIEKNYNTAKLINNIMQEIPPRNFVILRREYIRKSPTQAEVAGWFDLAGGSRSVRYIRDEQLRVLATIFKIEGVLSEPRYEEPKYAEG